MLTLPRPLLHIALVLALAACAAPPQKAPTPSAVVIPPTATAAPPPTPPSAADLAKGARVRIGERSLFIQCSPGPAGPTIILEAGLAGDHTSWAQVQPATAQFARVCSYDRAGIGQSDPAPDTPRSASASAGDLRDLLKAAGVPGPYLLVAHSFGGLLARVFVARYPDEVRGLILVDAVHPDWWQRALAALPAATPNDSQRLQSFRRFLASEVADPARNAEAFAIPQVADEARATGRLGRRPLIVLSAGVFDVVAPGLPAEVQERLRALFQQKLPAELAALSDDSTLIRVPDSGHAIPGTRPDLIVLAIQAALAAIANSA